MSIAKFKNKRMSILIMVISVMTMLLSQAFCLEGQLNQILTLIWTLTKFAGIVMIAIGVVQLIRAVIALTGGDQLQPGQLGKAIGLIAAGLAAAILETVLTGIGVTPKV